MQELIDSSALVADPSALRNRLAEHGYIFFRGLLPSEVIATVRGDLVDALRGAGWLADDADIDRPVPTKRAVREGTSGYFGAYVPIQKLQRLHELAHHQAVTDLLSGMMDGPLLVHPRKIVRTSLPHDTEYTPPHQDFPLIQGSVNALTCWIPIGDCPRSLGGLRVLVGSHVEGLHTADAAAGPGGLAVAVEDDDPRWASADYRAGDAIVFTSLTIHGALPNDEDYLRLSADFRYQPLPESVVEGSLLPHYYPQVPGWDIITSGWTSLEPIEAPDGLLVADMHPVDPALRAEPLNILK